MKSTFLNSVIQFYAVAIWSYAYFHGLRDNESEEKSTGFTYAQINCYIPNSAKRFGLKDA